MAGGPRTHPGALAFKICGVTRLSDASAAEAAGASYVGANVVPSSPRRVEAGVAAELAAAVSIPLVLITADMLPEDAARMARATGARAIQLHGAEPVETIAALRAAGTWELWKAVRVRSPADVLDAFERFGGVVDLLLLDGWDPARLGGTGRPFDWDAVAAVRSKAPEGLRLGIAGGLTPENVEEAVRRLEPDLVDVSSGVESAPGVKDHERIRELARKLARRARAGGE
jgi:phosphoribosylanthranilate isomerase